MKYEPTSIIKQETLDNIQLYATVCQLHPLLELEFDVKLLELEYKQKVCRLPLTILQCYSDKIKKTVSG